MPSKNPVAVYNMDNSAYAETFQDELIKIRPGQFVVMPRSDAIVFMGQNAGIDKSTGTWKVKNLEMKPYNKNSDVSGIRDVEASIQNTFRCHMDGQTFETQELLDEHLKTHAGSLIDSGEEPVGTPVPETMDAILGAEAQMTPVVNLAGTQEIIPVQTGLIKCPICAKDCKGAIGLKIHLTSHTKKK